MVVLFVGFAALIGAKPDLDLSEHSDRTVVEHCLLRHRTRLASHPDAQRVFAAYDARTKVPLKFARLRGPSALSPPLP